MDLYVGSHGKQIPGTTIWHHSMELTTTTAYANSWKRKRFCSWYRKLAGQRSVLTGFAASVGKTEMEILLCFRGLQ